MTLGRICTMQNLLELFLVFCSVSDFKCPQNPLQTQVASICGFIFFLTAFQRITKMQSSTTLSTEEFFAKEMNISRNNEWTTPRQNYPLDQGISLSHAILEVTCYLKISTEIKTSIYPSLISLATTWHPPVSVLGFFFW